MFDIPGGFKLTTDQGNVMVFRNIAAQVKWNTEQLAELFANPTDVPSATPDEEGRILVVNDSGQWRKSDKLIDLNAFITSVRAQIGSGWVDSDEGTLFYRFYEIEQKLDQLGYI